MQELIELSMHWPVSSNDGKNEINYIATWHAMELLLDTDKVRNIGVSNFSPAQLKDLIRHSTIKPAVHQFELHPYLQQADWVAWHQDNGISVTGYSPLGNLNPIYGKPGNSKSKPPSLLQNEDITGIARRRGCSNAQVALSWGMARGYSVIPKSQHADRIRENFASTGCALEASDNDVIEKVGKQYLKRFNDPSKGLGLSLFEGLDDSQ